MQGNILAQNEINLPPPLYYTLTHKYGLYKVVCTVCPFETPTICLKGFRFKKCMEFNSFINRVRISIWCYMIFCLVYVETVLLIFIEMKNWIWYKQKQNGLVSLPHLHLTSQNKNSHGQYNWSHICTDWPQRMLHQAHFI